MGCGQVCGVLVAIVGLVIAVAGFLVSGLLTSAVDDGLKNYQKNDIYLCKDDISSSKGWENFEGVNYWKDIGTSKYTAAYQHVFLYHITNAKEYLQGETGKVAEIGPFSMFTFSKAVDIVVSDAGVAYKSTAAHVFLDGEEIPIKGTNGDVAPTGTFAGRTPNGIDRFTPIANFNVGYLNALGVAGTEFALLLTASGCSATQIGNIASLMPTCSDKELDKGSPHCACCIPDDFVEAQDYAGLGMEKSLCDGLATSLDEGMIDQYTMGFLSAAGIATYNNVTWAALTDAQRMGHRVQAYTLNPSLNGAVADETTFHSIDNHTKALLSGFFLGIQGAEDQAKGGVMNATCSALGATLSVVGACGLTLNANLSSYTTADYRTIMRSFINSGPSGLNLATTNVWPVDNYDFDNGVWSSDTWEAASEAEQDGAVRAFSRYNAVNAAMLDLMDGDQTTVDSAFGITPESPAGDFRARMTVFSSSPPTIVENFPVPTNVFDVSALSEGIYLVEGDDDARVDWGTFNSYSDADKLAFTKKASKAYAIIGASQEGVAAYCSCDGGSKLDHSIPATGCCLQAGRVPDISGDPALSQDLTGWGCNFEE
uniref:Uncharacterized protein n=1 Tax=Triparma pacifica TaxID=91992 RepID=A0A7S2QV76_9STRA|mmetsp:Transcript_1623/g.2959  ORF Transcript_1623/g.2959 Transcript_1623/m.2959 type:complete len:597 (+) Transcript_1623:54-1844(+)